MARAEATPDARPDPLRRLGGGRWDTCSLLARLNDQHAEPKKG